MDADKLFFHFFPLSKEMHRERAADILQSMGFLSVYVILHQLKQKTECNGMMAPVLFAFQMLSHVLAVIIIYV